VPFLGPAEFLVLEYCVAQIPGEVNPAEIPVVAFPDLVMATGLVQVLVIQAGILGLAFPVEAFLVRNVAE